MAHKSYNKNFLDVTASDYDFDEELSGVNFSVKELNELEYKKRKRGNKQSCGPRSSPEWFLLGKIEKRLLAKLENEIDFHPNDKKLIKCRSKAVNILYSR